MKARRAARKAHLGKGPLVSAIGADGAVSMIDLPRYEDPACMPLWRPVWATMRQKLIERGLADMMMVGMVSDNWPAPEEVKAIHDLSGGLPWVSHCHYSATKRKGGSLYGVAPVGYESTVWDMEMVLNPAVERLYGWRREEFVVGHYRKVGVNRMTPSRVRGLAEMNITGNQRGIGRLGGDHWYAVKDKRGNRAGTVTDRYPESLWRNLDVRGSLLGPGPTGPVATVRYEYLREGIQECEARIMIEKALLDDAMRAKLGDELATRCQTLLDLRQRYLFKALGMSDERIESKGRITNSNLWERGTNRNKAGGAGHAWFVTSGWQQRSKALFTLAGEVAAKLR